MRNKKTIDPTIDPESTYSYFYEDDACMHTAMNMCYHVCNKIKKNCHCNAKLHILPNHTGDIKTLNLCIIVDMPHLNDYCINQSDYLYKKMDKFSKYGYIFNICISTH